jgi:hypothetical protein
MHHDLFRPPLPALVNDTNALSKIQDKSSHGNPGQPGKRDFMKLFAGEAISTPGFLS